MFFRRFVSIGILLAGTNVTPAGAASIIEISRTAIASTFVDVSGVFTDDDVVGFASDETGPFIEAAVSVLGFGDVANANAEALQESNIALRPGGFTADGGGSAGGSFDVFDPGFPSRATGNGETELSIVFHVNEPSEVVLAVALSAELSQLQVASGAGPVASLLRSSAQLIGANTGVVFALEVVDTAADGLTMTDTASYSGLLTPDTYRFEISSIAELRGFEDSLGLGVAGFGYDIVVVPEPATALLVGLGLVVAGIRETVRCQ